MEKLEPCYVIDATGNKITLFINESALYDMVEAFKNLSSSPISSSKTDFVIDIQKNSLTH